MATANSKAKNALSDLVDGNIWADSCPLAEEPDEYIVYYHLSDDAVEYGDNSDIYWNIMMAVHWMKKGNVNYTKMRSDIRKKLKDAGFTVSQVVPWYDDEAKMTHMIVNCSILEEDYYGAP